MNFSRLWKGTVTAFKSHKIAYTVMLVAIIVGGYEIYVSAKVADTTPQYQISRIRMGNIVQTVTGTGQVSAANQLSITSQVSGTIETINVSVGQSVKQGDLIATIDDTNTLNSLDSAKISLAKLTEAPTPEDLSNTQDNVTQSYGTAYNAISGLYLDLQTVMPGMNSLLNSPGTYLSDENSSQLTPVGQSYLTNVNTDYNNATVEYQSLSNEYAALSRQSSTSTVDQDLADAYTLAKEVANTLSDAQATVAYITANQPNYQVKDSATAQSDVVSWSNTMNTDVSNLLSAQTGITSAENALTTLLTGADPNDIASAQLAVQEAQQTYDNYFIRAPFDGVIGLIPVNVYGQAGNGTAIATIVGNQKIATLSLDEVDAAKVKVGDPVSVTFNAISNFTATGTVEEIDQVGTVTSGVVSYGVKVTINTADSRILPGMSVNATITTNEVDNVLVVPSTVVKTQAGRSYVQIFTAGQVTSLLPATSQRLASTTGGFASTTSGFASTTGGFASSTYARFASSTFSGGSYTGQYSGAPAVGTASRTVTISTSLLPTTEIVTTGQSDSSNTQILSGLTAGEWVVTKTIAAGSQTTTTTAAPSLLSSLGGGGARGAFGGGAGGGAARPAAAPAAQ